MKTNALFSSKSFPAWQLSLEGTVPALEKAWGGGRGGGRGGHCGPDPGRGRLTTVEFNNSPLNTREEEVRFGVYEVDSWKGRGGGGGGAVVVRPLELQRNFQVGSSKHVCTGSSVIPEPPTHTFTIFNLKKQDVIVLSQLITLNKEKKKLHRHPGWFGEKWGTCWASDCDFNAISYQNCHIFLLYKHE